MKKILVTIFIYLCFITASFAEEIRIITDDWPPYYGQNLEDQGFFSVIVKEAFKKAGYDPIIAFIPWKRAEKITKEGEVDVLLGAYYTKDRERFCIFSDPILETSIRAMVKKNSGIKFSGDLNDFKGLKIGKVRGYKISDNFLSADYLIISEATTLTQNIRKLFLGRIDIVIDSPIVITESMKHQFSQAEKSSIEFLEPPIVINDLYICFSKKIPNIDSVVKKFNTALSEMKKSGEVDKIKSRFGF